MQVTCDENHVYRTESGRVVMGVSEAIKIAGLSTDKWYTEQARWRGSVAHKVIELHNLGDLDPSSVDPQMVGYLAAYQKFEREAAFTVDVRTVEAQLYSQTYAFAGKIDCAGDVRGDLHLIDLKSGGVSNATELQLAAYSLLLEENGFGHVFLAYAVCLDKDGTYRRDCISITSRQRDQFRAALIVAKLKKEWRLA